MQRFEIPIELRAAEEEGGDGRTLEGRIVPYGEEIEVDEGREVFRAGVFSDTAAEDVVLLWQHDRSEPIGRMVEIRDEEDGAYGTFRLGTTPRALDAYQLASDRIVRGLSVGFLPEKSSRTRGGVREHVRARLVETSLVTFAAYPGAEITATREEVVMETIESPEVEAVPEEVEPSALEIRMEEARAEIRELRAHLANITTPGGTPPVPPMTLHAAYAELLRTVANKASENRALADVIGTAPGNASGLIHDQWLSELVGVLNVLRPLFSAAGSLQFPSAGYGIGFPRITQHTQVAKRSGEKTAIASRELTIDGVTYPMEWFAGGVDVSLELIAQSEPSVVEVVVGDLLDQYAIVTEAEFAVDTLAAATLAGAALPTGVWADFVGAVVETSKDIRLATGRPGDMLGLTSASWLAVVKLLNPSQPSISFGNGPDFTAESFTFGGITAFHAPALTVDVQFNQKALRKSERPPETVTATNVALMGRDIGVLGATIAVPLYPAGIQKYAAA